MAAVPLFRNTNLAALTSRENTPWSQPLREAKTLYGVFSPDLTATMLVYRTIAKESFGNLTLLLGKTCSIFCCRVFSHNVTAAILVSQNNETASMLVSQTGPVGVELFLMQTLSFVPINLHSC